MTLCMSYNVVKHEKNVLRITKNPCAKLDEETISFNVKKRKKPHSLHLTSQRRANNMYRGVTGHRVQKKDILCEDLDSDEEYEKENSVPITHSNSLSACSNSTTTFSTICESELKELTKYIRKSCGTLKLIKENSVAVEDLVDNHRRLDAVQHCCPQLFNLLLPLTISPNFKRRIAIQRNQQYQSQLSKEGKDISERLQSK